MPLASLSARDWNDWFLGDRHNEPSKRLMHADQVMERHLSGMVSHTDAVTNSSQKPRAGPPPPPPHLRRSALALPQEGLPALHTEGIIPSAYVFYLPALVLGLT